ncbi:extracellular solute-binding protein [Actinopolymorpha sp. B9G3]|uniref:ABC transporter substrate-binding protein n=1 Tax=Actinopolymorpha sp. B9G3 TaxID=3158970 RepID=UPI0032D9840D
MTFHDGITRRSLLKGMAGGGVLAVAGGALASCSRDGGGSGGADIVLTTGNRPYGPMPTAAEQKANPTLRAYAEALSAWSKKNPGITIKRLDFDTDNQELLVTSLAGGTAPSMFPGDVVGGWNRTAVKAAMVKGLVADVTDHLEEHKLHDKLADYAKPIWDGWAIDGKYYAAPLAYNCGTGIHYRADLIKELGLKEPTPDWTWDDVRELAKGLTTDKRKGIGLQSWGLGMRMAADGMGMFTEIPAPETTWNWRWDYTTNADTWVPLVEGVRGMIFEDKSVLADVTLNDPDIWNAFIGGTAAMHNNSMVFFTNSPDEDTTNVVMEKRFDKPLEELVGWMTQPIGTNGRIGTTQGQTDLLSYSPDLDEDALDAAVNLHTYMSGDGYILQKKAIFDQTKDPRRIYDWANVTPIFAGIVEALPSSPDEAWGTTFMDAVRHATQIPLVPQTSWYFPAEENSGPTTTAYDDATQKWYSEAKVDIRADLGNLEQTRNKQAADFTSSAADEEFVAAAKKYYGDHATYWEKNAPEFYQNVFKGWYDQTVAPALG